MIKVPCRAIDIGSGAEPFTNQTGTSWAVVAASIPEGEPWVMASSTLAQRCNSSSGKGVSKNAKNALIMAIADAAEDPIPRSWGMFD